MVDVPYPQFPVRMAGTRRNLERILREEGLDDQSVMGPVAGTLHRLFRQFADDEIANYDAILTGAGGVVPTVLIAASDARQEIKDAASLVATGTDDHLTVMEALGTRFVGDTGLLPASGGRLVMSAGTWNFSDRAYVDTDKYPFVHIRGMGDATLIQREGSSSPNPFLFLLQDVSGTGSGNAVTISDMRLDGAITEGQLVGVYVSDQAVRYKLDRIAFTNLHQGVWSDESTSRFQIADCFVEDCTWGLRLAGLGTVADCYLLNTSNYGIYLGGTANFGSHIQDCIIENADGNAGIYAGVSARIADCTVDGGTADGYIIDWNQVSLQNSYAYNMGGVGVNFGNLASDNLVEGCLFYLCAGGGIHLTDGSNDSNRIFANSVIDCGSIGIALSQADSNKMWGNLVDGHTTGIDIADSGSVFNYVLNNWTGGNTTPIADGGTSTQFEWPSGGTFGNNFT